MKHDIYAKGLRFLWHAISSKNNPLLAQLVVTRRCNLSCAYCNEYDNFSAPIPFDALKSRITKLARLNTFAITLTGGEPMLHPDIDRIIRYINSLGLVSTIITNGYLLTKERIELLNEAGLHELQISIDNIQPDEISMKSLKVLDRKLKLLAEIAEFKVNINSVLGISDERTDDAIAIAQKACDLGFSHSVGLVHNEHGILKPLSPKQIKAYQQIGKITKSRVHFFNKFVFQQNLITGKPNRWQCRAGARYLYICELGLVHWCSQQRGYPGIPLLEYSQHDIQREFNTAKKCSPMCSVTCVQQMSFLDNWRPKQKLADPKATPIFG